MQLRITRGTSLWSPICSPVFIYRHRFFCSPSKPSFQNKLSNMQQHDVNKNNGDPAAVHVETRSFAFVLSFSNLTYSVKSPKKMKFLNIFSQKDKLGTLDEQGEADIKFGKTKVLLNNISGEAGDGEIMAILGASGSGKSTLIDALANRIAKGSLKGTVKLNGEPLESTLQKTITAYVMQDDLLYPMLTVEETLAFSAEFRLPYSMSKSKKKARVEALIDQLGLRNVVNTVIGNEGHRGVSGGERRRVSIGVDIIHDPLLLFLDEPTSGLDSTSAFMVVKVLQKIAQSGSVVIMSIHQPSYRVCSLLDRMIILSKGQTAFSGSPSAIARYFSEFGHPIAENENWTEFALDLILELESSPGGTRSLVEFNKSWEAREGSREFGRGLSIQDAINVSIAKGKLVSFGVSAFSNPMWKEVKILSKRSILNSWRLPELFGVRLGAVVVTGFILGTTFWKLDNSPRGILERFGFFASALSTTYYVSANSLPVFLEERFIFMRETAYNTYRRSSYVISRSLVAIPAIIIMSISFAVLTFWALGLSGGLSGFWFFLLIILASFWAGSSVVTFFSGAVPSLILAYAVGIAFLSYYFFLSGFCINRDRIPPYWIWLHYLSLMKYTYEAMVHNEFDDPSKCFVRGAQIFDNTPIGSVPESVKNNLLKSISNTLGFNITSNSCVITGPDILLSQGVSGLSKWDCLWITIAWGFLFRILFYFTLLIGSKNKRR